MTAALAPIEREWVTPGPGETAEWRRCRPVPVVLPETRWIARRACWIDREDAT